MNGRNADGSNSFGGESGSSYKYAMDSGSYVGAPYNFVPFSKRHLYEYDENRRPKHNEITRKLQGQSIIDVGEAGEDELYTGEVEYTMTAQTPILIDGGKKDKDGKSPGEFNKLPYFDEEKGKYVMQYAIPGSTAHGLIRNNVQILGFCGFADDIDDYALMYRAVANGAEHNDYANMLGARQDNETRSTVLDNVRAGYIVNVGGGNYKFLKASTEGAPNIGTNRNYYVLKENRIGAKYWDYQNPAVSVRGKNKEPFPFDFFIQKNSLGQSLTQYNMPIKYRKDGGKKYTYENEINAAYLPYALPVVYQIDSGKISSVRNPGDYKDKWYKGYAVSSGAMSGKQAVYIIPWMKEDEGAVLISKDDINAFRIDLEKRWNSLKGNLPSDWEEIERSWNSRNNNRKSGNSIRDEWRGMSYFGLPAEDDAPKPCFYIDTKNLNEDEAESTSYNRNMAQVAKSMCFGFTPHLRVFYRHTVKDGLSRIQKMAGEKGTLDYARAMFGSIDKKGPDGNIVCDAFKSRVSFSDLFLKEGTDVHITEDARILAEPKPTSYLDYLNNGETYNTETKDDTTGADRNFQLRGVKQYWLHESLTDAGRKSSATEGQQDNELVWSVMKPLSPQIVGGTEVKPVFQGKIRFKNLTKDELGLLLWSVRLEENSEMNIGKGKAYGFGRVKVDILSARRVIPEQAYNPELFLREIETQGIGDSVRDIDGTLFQEPFEDLNIDDLIEYYKGYIGRKLAEQQTQKNRDNRKKKSRKEKDPKVRPPIDVMKEPQIQSFLRMKDVTQMPSEDQIRYMDINKGEYQKRTSNLITLPTANEVPPAGEGNT